MPQNGIHAIVGTAVSRKWMPKKEWLLLGVVLGNMFPDLDNVLVAVATLQKQPTEQAMEIYHRTFTHSVFTILAVLILFYLIAAITKNQKWNNFGQGFGAGILMHILVDLVLWFNGVALFWPLGGELNFWSWFEVPPALKIFLDTGEFLAFGLYCMLLVALAGRQATNRDYVTKARTFAYIQFVLFILFTVLFFTVQMKLLATIFGALYLLSMFYAIGITIRMKDTIETV
jgi:membrane-bound metal-dependent hydrolase YbcI (DUF457 family)